MTVQLKQLPIWRDANRFLLLIEKVVKTFPKYHKYTLGTELRKKALTLCNVIHQAWHKITKPDSYSNSSNTVLAKLKYQEKTMVLIHHRFKVISMAFILSIMQVSVAQAAQKCQSAIPKTTPTANFTVHNDGTVTHNPTSLMWKVCSEGQTWQSSDGSCSGKVTTHTWQAALQISQTLNTQGGYAGHTDWRLPNINELDSIAELSCYSPAINTEIFNNTPAISFYWSASPVANGSDYTWIFSFTYANIGNYKRGNDSYVRLVRSGQ